MRKPARPCRDPMCPHLTDDGSGYCPTHKKQQQWLTDSRRGTPAERGYTARWANYSRLFRKEHPLCVMCLEENRVIASEEVDHIIAVTGPDDPLFWRPSNHRALCGYHHKQKTVKEDHGFGSSPTRRSKS